MKILFSIIIFCTFYIFSFNGFAEQSFAETSAPPLADHFYVVLRDEDYQKLGKSKFLKQLGFLEFQKTVKIGNRQWTGSYLSGESFYIEFFSDKPDVRNVQPQDLQSNSGLGFVADYGTLIDKMGPDSFPLSDTQRLLKSYSKENGNFLSFAVSKNIQFWIWEPPMNLDGSIYDRRKPILDLRIKKKDPKIGSYPLKDLELLQIEVTSKDHSECQNSLGKMFFKIENSGGITRYSGSGQTLEITEKSEGPRGILRARFTLNESHFDWPVGMEQKIGNLVFKRVSNSQFEISF